MADLSSQQSEQVRGLVRAFEECAAALRRCKTTEDVHLVLAIAGDTARAGVTLEDAPTEALRVLHSASTRLQGVIQRTAARP